MTQKELWEEYQTKCPWRSLDKWETYTCGTTTPKGDMNKCDFKKCAPAYWANRLLEDIVKGLKGEN